MNLKTENRKPTPPIPLFNKEGVPKAGALRVKGVRVGRLRFPHLPIHLFTGLIFFALITVALPAWAAVPGTLSYQGKLSNSSGTPVNGTVSMAFAIYGVSTGGTALWTETQGSVNVASGIFTVTLGSVTSIHSTVFSNIDLYLGIKVGADAEMTPRQKINSVPFAIKSDTAESATSGGVPSGFMILGDSSTPPAGYTYTGETVGNNQWVYKSPMPHGRYAPAAAVVNGKVYVIGGSGVAYNEEFDPVTNSWTSKTPMPTVRGYLAAAVVNNKIYVIGGDTLTTVEEYDPVTDTWMTKAPMPTGRSELAVGTVNNKIYAIGGYGSGGVLGTLEEYDPATNTWTTKASMPTARDSLAAVAVNNKIYAIGGELQSDYASQVEEYDPVSDIWTTKAAMSIKRGGLAAAVATNKIYVIGGCNMSGCTEAVAKSTEIYDPSENSWTNGLPVNERRAYSAAASINNKIYIVASSWSNLDTVEELNTKTYYVHRKD